jgi:hypothetical protein
MEMIRDILSVVIPVVMGILIIAILYYVRLYFKYWRLDKRKADKLKELDYLISNSTDYKEIVELCKQYDRIRDED